jgi:hypothetical protein
MFIIGEAIVQRDVTDSKFSCDLHKCKGACCTMEGGRGAPLLDGEIAQIEKALPFAREYLDDRHRLHIERYGFYDGYPGDYATACIDEKACVFVYYDDGIARCSLDRAFNNGGTSWKKPISCHLFPIRISNGNPVMVRYERIPECGAGIKKGLRENTALIEFLEEPLRRRFGNEWYECLLSHINGVSE